MLSNFAIVDVEATGGNHRTGRIIDISIFTIQDNEVVELFSSLINPHVSIDKFVSRLTGINDEMVENAPSFDEVAEIISHFLSNKIFVAHNVSFDYQFVQKELSRSGISLNTPTLCTLLLSKKLIPEYDSHSLGKLSSSLGIGITDRHRAAGDAKATSQLLLHLMQSTDFVQEANLLMNVTTQQTNLNKNLKVSQEVMNSLPNETGVFYFKNTEGKILLVERGDSIKSTAHKFLSSNKNKKMINFRHLVTQIDFVPTGNNLLAELLFYSEIFRYMPVANLQPKLLLYRYCIASVPDYPYLYLARTRENPTKPLLYFKDYKTAEKVLYETAKKYQLSAGMVSFYLNRKKKIEQLPKQVNFDENQLKQFQLAVRKLKSNVRNALIVADGRTHEEKCLFLIQNQQFMGFTFQPNQNFKEQLPNLLPSFQRLDVLDGDKIIRRFLDVYKNYQIINIK